MHRRASNMPVISPTMLTERAIQRRLAPSPAWQQLSVPVLRLGRGLGTIGVTRASPAFADGGDRRCCRPSPPPGGDRHQKRAAVQRDRRGAGAADGDGRGAAGRSSGRRRDAPVFDAIRLHRARFATEGSTRSSASPTRAGAPRGLPAIGGRRPRSRCSCGKRALMAAAAARAIQSRRCCTHRDLLGHFHAGCAGLSGAAAGDRPFVAHRTDAVRNAASGHHSRQAPGFSARSSPAETFADPLIAIQNARLFARRRRRWSGRPPPPKCCGDRQRSVADAQPVFETASC